MMIEKRRMLRSFPTLSLVTSNDRKLDEYRRMGLPVMARRGLDLPEVDADPLEVVIRKAASAGAGAVVEDTILILDGEPVVDIRWKIDEIPVTDDAVWQVLLGYNTGDAIRVYRGVTHGRIVRPETVPEGAFGFDPYFVPDDARNGAALAMLEQRGRKDTVSARRRAIYALLGGEEHAFRYLADIGEWTGAWQNH